MTRNDFIQTFQAKGRGSRWRAKCPCHKSRGLTLALWEDDKGFHIFCHAGCSKDDVLAAVGLTWKDLKPQKEWLTTEQYAEARKQREKEKRRTALLKADALFWTDETRLWERIAKRMHDALRVYRDTPDEGKVARLWRKSLATARGANERRVQALQGLNPSLDRYKIGGEVEW